MPKACFKSMTFKSAAHASNATLHNNRDTIPDYLVKPKRENFYEMRTNPMQLLDEIKRNSERLGKRLNARAKPLREAVILLDDDHDISDVKACIDRLENELNMRPLWIAIHEDEGHIDKETGEVIYNRHVHFGYTNYDTENHRCYDMNRTVMTQAQNIVAESLGLERGRSKKETGAVGLDHKTFRAVARKQAESVSMNKDLDAAKQEAKILADENKRLREELKATKQATKDDYQELNRLKKSEIDLQEKLAQMQKLLEEVQAREKEKAEKIEEQAEQIKKLEEDRQALLAHNAELEKLRPPLHEIEVQHFKNVEDAQVAAKCYSEEIEKERQEEGFSPLEYEVKREDASVTVSAAERIYSKIQRIFNYVKVFKIESALKELRQDDQQEQTRRRRR